MFGMRVKTQFRGNEIKDRFRQASITSLGHAGAAIRLTARRSIRRRKSPSRPGQPPHTRKGQLKRSLRYAVDKGRERVLIGPTYSIVGRSGSAHEFGGRYKRNTYPKRSFMGPALKKIEKRLPGFWAASIK